MKRVRYAICLLICCALASPARAMLVYNESTQILTDTQAGRMWLMRGVGFGSSYPYPELANTWISGLNASARGGYSDWRLPTVPSGDPTPLALSGDLGGLFTNLSTVYPNRDDWPFGLGATAYGGNLIFTDLYADGGRFWAMSFGNGGYQSIYCGYAYAYVGTMAVREFTGLPGDFDVDGDVDGYDFLMWQRGESPRPLSAIDLADWQNTYGAVDYAPLVAGVPEPPTVMLVMLALAGTQRRRLRV